MNPTSITSPDYSTIELPQLANVITMEHELANKAANAALGHDQPLPWSASLDEGLVLADSSLANPIRDHVPQTAPKRRVRGVLSILDQLDRQNSTRRFTT